MNTTGNLKMESQASSEIQKLDQAFFPHPWTSEQWLAFNPEHIRLMGWYAESKLIGFCLFSIVAGDNVAHLLKILVAPTLRSQGVATQFWSAIVKTLKFENVERVYLEVEAGNLAALAFYHKHGFKLLRRNKAYYSNGEDALVMELML
jgi:ribosomal-protein-alanine N-acetyltransferase